jgi:hypothetical protein
MTSTYRMRWTRQANDKSGSERSSSVNKRGSTVSETIPRLQKCFRCPNQATRKMLECPNCKKLLCTEQCLDRHVDEESVLLRLPGPSKLIH